MNKKRISFLVRFLFCISLILGIYLNITKVSSMKKILAYYTLQVNIFCLLVLVITIVYSIVKKDIKNNLYYFIKGEAIISTLLMIIVYEIALAPNSFEMYQTSNKFADFLVHVVTPVIILFDYLLFDKKGNFKMIYPILWLLFPILYIIFIYTYSANGGRFYSLGGSTKYAYEFLNIEKYGYLKVSICIFFMMILVIILGFLLVFVDKKIKACTKNVTRDVID